MPFPYRFVCDLLQQLEEEAHPTNTEKTSSHTIIERWFDEHRVRLDAPTVNGCAVISTLLPERRTDRVYGIQAPRLESIIGQALILGSSRVKELRRYKTPGQGVDLGDCVESILSRTPNPTHPEREVTVEDIDEVLTRVAAACRFSSETIKASKTNQPPLSVNHVLGRLFTRISSRDAKWFTRLVLKNYQPIVIEERVVLRAYHALLPRILKVRDDLQIATDFLQHVGPSTSDPEVVASLLRPALGIKVGRQPWLKARSIQNCVDIIGRRQISCEQKIDGEYCQIHVDLSNQHAPIQIFSKSGKDSTQDRRKLHPLVRLNPYTRNQQLTMSRAIRDSLRTGQQGCPFKTGCILEGELVVYSTKDNKVLPFHKIRKHVSRSGSFIGSNNDSQRHDYEHLMIIYYDILMLDTQSMLGIKHSERMKHLEKLITCRKGHAEIVQRHIISFSRHSAASTLREVFARCIVAKGEGVVLKPDEPYFDFRIRQSRFGSCVVKLKKEYVQGWGDVGDFAVVGASYDSVKAKSYNIAKLKWTHFFIGCLENRECARDGTEKPAFVVTNIVELPETLLRTLRTHCEPRAVPFDDNEFFTLDFRGTGSTTKPTEVFLNPPVFDMRCFSFDKEPNSRSWSMRFPYVSKIHFDRSYLDTISFTELQQAAHSAIEAPEPEDSQEMRHWISALEKADPRGRAADKPSQDSIFSDLKTGGVGAALDVSSRVGSTDASSKAPVGLDTQPRPSGANARKSVAGTSDTMIPDARTKPSKRAAETSGTISKRQRGSVGNGAEDLLPTIPPRRPLASIDGNNSPGNQCSSLQNGSSMFVQTQRQTVPSSPMGENGIVSSAAGSFTTANELPSSPPLCVSTPRQGQPEKPATPTIESAAQVKCIYKGASCAFTNSSILLAPCISSYAWVTDDLLKNHGIVSFEVDPEAWKRRPSSSGPSFSSPPRVSVDTPGQTQRSVKIVRKRKICLVETRRPKATREFLMRIEEAGLKKRDGQREWVAVYDWRILEDFAHIETGSIQKGFDPWRQRYTGII
ncbi:uncharacterized protein PG998_007347 [Apiospora kogelbergensis]|uniref:uncharacterized protein n=1 Tax=Apiospora kogelbergensis TaxID=1337665 RepID=UPI00312F949F